MRSIVAVGRSNYWRLYQHQTILLHFRSIQRVSDQVQDFPGLARVPYNYIANRKNRGNMIYKKLLSFVGIGALLTTICAPSTIADVSKALPAPGTYKIDPDHSFAYFGAWHHVVGLVRGRFDKVTGIITVSQDLAACSVEIMIDASSISTQNTERDEDLRGPDFFDVKKFVALTYQGRGIRRISDGAWIMDGSLTIRGVTKVVPLTFTFKGLFPDTRPGKPARAAFHASAATKRADFGMTRDNLMELGAFPSLKPDVEIEIDVEADANLPSR
jgi:polyisoprenoid-binding protein YceI